MEDKQSAAKVLSKSLRNASGNCAVHFSRALVQVARWRQLHRDRAELSRLSDDRLRDIGLSRADVRREACRPFWEDPLKR
ncbi:MULTISPECIES: DUF1127 domain-containing protein [unclassified Pseudomonas]|uniref:DUF1127 domain-containing protein n=1 Tax=unclassified Pseudomonas TaxID=196821 RepID=UPI0009E9F11F|nr:MULTISPECIES: DUF1127 domain-containing protein [unclassified Pseudomonas]MBV7479958.1 DUF1127 domain-containing protein [Pseudomonas sp. PDM31]